MASYKKIEAEIKAYNKVRDAMLLQRDVDALIEFMKDHGLQLPSSRASAEVTLHKTITGVHGLPFAFRKESYQWLTERGYTSLDDGELR